MKLLAAITCAAAVTAAAAAKPLTPDRIRFWDAVAACETGGRWDWGARHRPGEGRTYQGGVGFYWGTWRWWASELGLLGMYPAAFLAPRLIQMRVAEHGLTKHRGYWGCL